jgi:lauroyl/myristoyl acyltransferase
MTTQTMPDLSEQLAAARRPPERPPSAVIGLRAKLFGRPWLRGLVPVAIAVRRAEARGRATWERQPEKRAQALATMEAVLAGTTRAEELESLARRHVIEAEVVETMFWRPWRGSSIDGTSDARLRAALADERGVLISTAHLQPFIFVMGLVVERGGTPFSVSAPWLFAKPEPGEWAQRLDRWWQGIIERRRERLVSSVGSFAVLRALLEQGETVYLFFDMPGSRETRFLGKPVMLSTGSARLAFETGAPILPTRTWREGSRFHTEIGEPLDPRDYTSVEELHDALAAVHERWILMAPEALEDPRRAGAWEESATPTSWTRPPAPPAAT